MNTFVWTTVEGTLDIRMEAGLTVHYFIWSHLPRTGVEEESARLTKGDMEAQRGCQRLGEKSSQNKAVCEEGGRYTLEYVLVYVV